MSTSKHVLRKRQVEMLPLESGPFSYTSNDKIMFSISSSTEFMDAMDSYIRFKVTTTGRSTRAFSDGGVHALFREMTLRTQNGTLIERIDRYGHWASLWSNMTMTSEYVDKHGHQYGDSATLTGKALAQSASVEMCLKPLISFLMMEELIPLPFIRQGLLLELTLDRPEFAFQQTDAATPDIVTLDGVDSTAMSYTISEPRYVCSMITLDESIVKSYLDRFNGGGINYSLSSIRHKRGIISASNASNFSFPMSVGVRSATAVFAFLQAERVSELPTALSTEYNDSKGTYVRTSLTSYQFQAGSDQFPDREINIDTYNNEAHRTLEKAIGRIGEYSFRFSPAEYSSTNTVYVTSTDETKADDQANETTKLVMSAQLSRDHTSHFTGTDLSINPLDLNLTFNGTSPDAFGNRVLNIFVVYDYLCSLSKDGLIIRS